jgi:O-antigen/teichoic acid export membrane protein
MENNDSAEKGRENANSIYAGNLAKFMKYHANAPRETRETSKGMPPALSKAQQAQRDSEAQQLLRRTPSNYLFSQAYGMWLFLSLFLVTLILTHNISTTAYGIYAATQTLINTIIYIVILGFEDALVTFVPRVSVERGKVAAAYLIRQLLLLRIAVLVGCTIIILFFLPELIWLVNGIGTWIADWITDPLLAWLANWFPIATQRTESSSDNFQNAVLLEHTRPIALYVLGAGIVNLLQSVCAAQMRMIRVLVVGGLVQLGLVIFGFVVLYLGWGVDGVLWMQAIVTLLGAIAFVIWLAPLLFVHKTDNKQPLRPVLNVALSAWLTNLASGALFKQISITLLAIYAISLSEIGFFNLAFQLADAANMLLVSGFAGVGASALATSFVSKNYERLGLSWQSLIKVETLLAAPLLVFCLLNAQNIAIALYGSKFAAVGSLLAIFLAFNLFYRIIGSTIHQSSLYIVEKPYAVVISQWLGLSLILVFGIILVPRFGPAGALIADGIAKALTGVFMLVFLLRRLPRKYPLGLLSFTLRFLFALTIAALPGLLWHPAGLLQLGLSGLAFAVLCLGMLVAIKPLSGEDLEMIATTKPGLARYIRWFTQK